ncbi:MAG: hypothetical protein A3C36_06210 [Omnitrophica WOR_2 bacterium RIFCSPHIGHO2_02_FULL_52_10]|nr:MAG: hypothetical protein A3C36_06210 [Omnitrophica WOR_2 bacterium RIFCSPHIGHO2_02_FULL_52_10]
MLRQIKRLFGRVDASVASFRKRTSLSCRNGCGQCCLTPKVETTVLEMLPLAEYLMGNRQANFWYDRAKEASFAGPCVLYSIGKYKKRMLLENSFPMQADFP